MKKKLWNIITRVSVILVCLLTTTVLYAQSVPSTCKTATNVEEAIENYDMFLNYTDLQNTLQDSMMIIYEQRIEKMKLEQAEREKLKPK